jgi:hypothetical protein
MQNSVLAASFALFDDSDDDTEFVAPSDQDLQLLKQSVAQRQTSQSTTHQTTSTQVCERDPLATSHLWPSAPPRYIGPLKLVEHDVSVGGGRGFVAARDVRPGELLLAEAPFVHWSQQSMSLPGSDSTQDNATERSHKEVLWAGMCAILSRADREHVLSNVQLLHPVRLSDLTDEELSYFHKLFDHHIAAFLVDPQSVSMYRLNDLVPDVLLRLLVALQCNGFSSGLYLHLAIVNHACMPNCIKFTPASGNLFYHFCQKHCRFALLKLCELGAGNGCSEIRAITHIAAETPITICYLNPLEQSVARRQHILSTQFRFECRCQRCLNESTFASPSHVESLLCASCRPSMDVHVSLESELVNMDVSKIQRFFEPHQSLFDSIALASRCSKCERSVTMFPECSENARQLEIELEQLELEIASPNFTMIRATRSLTEISRIFDRLIQAVHPKCVFRNSMLNVVFLGCRPVL